MRSPASTESPSTTTTCGRPRGQASPPPAARRVSRSPSSKFSRPTPDSRSAVSDPARKFSFPLRALDAGKPFQRKDAKRQRRQGRTGSPRYGRLEACATAPGRTRLETISDRCSGQGRPARALVGMVQRGSLAQVRFQDGAAVAVFQVRNEPVRLRTRKPFCASRRLAK